MAEEDLLGSFLEEIEGLEVGTILVELLIFKAIPLIDLQYPIEK
jgi:hypothetical protein